MNKLGNSFVKYIEIKMNDEDVPQGFWTEVSSNWNALEDEENELTNNAVRKRFKRRLEFIDLSPHLPELEDLLYDVAEEFGLRGEDADVFFDTLVPMFDRTSPPEIKELTETEFNKNNEMQGSSIIRQTELPYYYNATTGTYVFYLSKSNSSKPLIIEEEDLKSLKQRYSNWDGDNSSINEVCRDFGIPRSWFTKLKTSLGWTHDSEPFLDSEIMNRDSEEMVEEVLENKKRVLYQKMKMREWDEVQDKAKKYDEIDAFLIEPLHRKISESKGSYGDINVNLNGLQRPSELSFVFAPTDLHINKLPYDINKFTPNEYENQVRNSAENVLNKVFNICTPSEIISIVGSDLFHVDNIKNATSAGTEQAGQIYGNYFDVLYASYSTMYDVADIVTETGIKNEFFTIRGNHDAILSLGIGEALTQRYKNESHVSVNNTVHDRKYKLIGKYLIGMTHGEYLGNAQSTRTKNIQGRILTDAKEHKINTTDVISYYIFSGHVHRSSANHHEDTGIFDIVCPSLSVTDWWHYLHNYTGNTRAIAGYLISPDSGLEYIIYDNMNLIDYKN